MAHETQVKGALSEMTATIALMANGWQVSAPSVDELYDLVGRCPKTLTFKTIQVKTIRRRKDRNNEMVVYATNGKGEAYQPEDCDYIIGVEDESVYLIPCTGIKEYWATDEAAKRKWTKLDVKGVA